MEEYIIIFQNLLKLGVFLDGIGARRRSWGKSEFYCWVPIRFEHK